jgi:uncharacterized integral membrane protein (TIGR00698 family)
MSQPDYSWAEYLDYMEGGGSDVVSLPAKPKPVTTVKKEQPLWGILVALGVTVAAIWLCEIPFWPFTIDGGRHPIEPVMMAIILGMIFNNTLTLPKALQPGIKYAVKKLLPIGIVLIGVRLDFGQLVRVGFGGLAMSVLETIVALGLLLVLTRFLRLPQKLGILLGVGTAICGGTAIVATAPVIEAEEKDVVFSVATVTLLGLLAMFVMPFLGHLLSLTDKAFGIWAGLAIHQTPQVVAAGFAYSDAAGETATIVKLARVCLLAPVVFIIGVIYARSKSRHDGPVAKKKINYWKLFPMFVFGFLAMALLKTLGLLPELTVHKAAVLGGGTWHGSVGSIGEQVSKFFITISMAGVGLETKFSAMRQTGLKPFVASLFAVLVVASLILALLKIFAL